MASVLDIFTGNLTPGKVAVALGILSSLYFVLTPKMPAISGLVDFNPEKDIPSLEGKVILITGGTAGLGTATIKHLAYHKPQEIYFTGRNRSAGTQLVTTLSTTYPDTKFTFIEMDLSSLASVKSAITQSFTSPRLDILILNAGIMAQPPSLSKDGYEITFATNHLGHAMLLQQVLPTLLSTAKNPSADVRVITLSSLGFRAHPRSGINFQALEKGSEMESWFLGSWIRYGQSKLANILMACHLGVLHPSITTAAIHPGVVKTPLVDNTKPSHKALIYVSQWVGGNRVLTPEEGAWNTVWAAAGKGTREVLRKRQGGFWLPVGVDGWDSTATARAKDGELAKRLWEWTEGVLAKF